MNEQGEIDDAIAESREDLRAVEHDFGHQDARVAEAMRSLATELIGGELYEEAEDLYHRALGIYTALGLGETLPAAQAREEFAQMLASLSRFDEAAQLGTQAYDVYVAVWGDADPRVTRCLLGLADARRGLSQYDVAETLCRRALAILGAQETPDFFEFAGALITLALTLEQLSRSGEAEQVYRQALEVYETILDPNDPEVILVRHNTSVVLNNLARLLEQSSREREAEPMRRRAKAIRDAVDEKINAPKVPYDPIEASRKSYYESLQTLSEAGRSLWASMGASSLLQAGRILQSGEFEIVHAVLSEMPTTSPVIRLTFAGTSVSGATTFPTRTEEFRSWRKAYRRFDEVAQSMRSAGYTVHRFDL
jgi:tetratricopeptide (TPR) repeat protein